MPQFKFYNDKELLDLLEDIIKFQRPHKDYDRVQQVAKWGYQIMTGDDHKDILIRYKRKETDAQQEQRINITNSKTQYASNKVIKLFNEVHRADNVVDEIRYDETEDADGLEMIQNALSEFYQTKEFKDYLNRRYQYYNFYDPNAFLVIEFRNDDPANQLPTVYPFEVSSREAYNYEYLNGILQYLVVRQPEQYKSRKDQAAYSKQKKQEAQGEQDSDYIPDPGYKIGMTYTMYAAEVAYVMKHIPEDVEYTVDEGFVEKRLPVEGYKEEQLFLFRAYDTETKRCPAMRFGYFEDPKTKNRTCVTPLFPAEKVFTDLIWTKSEYDLTKALHGFYQKFIYVQKCTKCAGTGIIRSPGAISDKDCTACQGKGKLSHTTVQDVVEITMPDEAQDVIPLQNLVYYAEVPQWLMDKQKTDIDESVRDVYGAVFNENIFDRAQAAETATANKLNWRSVYNALIPYSDHYSDMYIFGVETVADILEKGDNLIVNHSISSDFKLESIDELLQQRSTAVAAGVPNEIVRTIDLNILAKQHRDDPQFVEDHKARQKFLPLRGKSKEERITILSGFDDLDPVKVLYVYFDDIMDLIFDEHPDFAEMPWKKQRDIVDQAVVAYIAALETEVPSTSIIGQDAGSEEDTEGQPQTDESLGEGEQEPPESDTQSGEAVTG